MFKKLQTRWKVSGINLLLIITTFALGGSACAQLSRITLHHFYSGNKDFFWWVLYIVLVTLLWPVCVLIISIPLFQYRFFSNYLKRVGRRIFLKAFKSKSCGNNIAIFSSGKGSNAENIISFFSYIKTTKVSLIVSNKPDAGVIGIAEKHNKKVLIIDDYKLIDAQYLIEKLNNEGVRFIVLAGFLKKIPPALIAAFPRRIVNIHPSLLPDFGGKGMYGMKVHEAVIRSGASKSGITIHLVDEYYDRGDVLFQAECEVAADDTPETLWQKIHNLEMEHYPAFIRDFVENAKS